MSSQVHIHPEALIYLEETIFNETSENETV